MPTYHVRISNGGGIYSDIGMTAPTRDAAWVEMTRICGDLIRDATRALQQNEEWQIELLDQAETPVGRIRLVAESAG